MQPVHCKAVLCHGWITGIWPFARCFIRVHAPVIFSSMQIIYTKNPHSAAGTELARILSKYQNHAVLLLVSGGSAFSVLEECDTAVLGVHVTVGVLDERYSSDPRINNFLQLKETVFFKEAMRLGAKCFDTSIGENDSQAALAARMEKGIRNWINENPAGKIIATMGIGEDGHTAGILPETAAANFDDGKIIASYSVGKEINPYPERVSASLAFLRDGVDEAVVYAVGEKKQRVIGKLGNEKIALRIMPARILNKMRTVAIFTDG